MALAPPDGAPIVARSKRDREHRCPAACRASGWVPRSRSRDPSQRGATSTVRLTGGARPEDLVSVGELQLTIKDMQDFYDYGHWANGRLFEAIAQLTPEQFIQPAAGGYGSIRDTLVHVLSAQWGWLDRCGGPKRGPRLDPADYPTPESLAQTWNKVDDYARAFFATLSDADLDRVVEFTLGGPERYSASLGHLLQHAAVHAVHHRGQVALMLRLLGYAPGNFDVLFYPGEGGVQER